MLLRRFSAMLLAVLCCMAAHGSSYRVTVAEGLTRGTFDTVNGNPFTGTNTASATFLYTGRLYFNNSSAQNDYGAPGDLNSLFGFSASNISDYQGSGTVVYNGAQVADYSSASSFLSSYGSSGSYRYGSYYTFDLGDLGAGTELTITHDDGISVFQNGARVGSSSSADTPYVTDQIKLAQSGQTVLRYARENGTPSFLKVTAVTPEPSSLALLGTGALLLIVLQRKRSIFFQA